MRHVEAIFDNEKPKYLKPEEDLNTPKDEMMAEAIHCMVEQREYEIWKVACGGYTYRCTDLRG